jgi:hypothetical protein
MMRAAPRARRIRRAAACAVLVLASACTTVGDTGVSFYGSAFYYDDPWYWNGCCYDPPDSIGPPPPRPAHPIALPPEGARPENPIADPPRVTPQSSSTRATPMPRAGGMRGGGGGGRGGGGRR